MKGLKEMKKDKLLKALGDVLMVNSKQSRKPEEFMLYFTGHDSIILVNEYDIINAICEVVEGLH